MKAKFILWSWLVSWPGLFIGAGMMESSLFAGGLVATCAIAANIVFIRRQHDPAVEKEADRIARMFERKRVVLEAKKESENLTKTIY